MSKMVITTVPEDGEMPDQPQPQEKKSVVTTLNTVTFANGQKNFVETPIDGVDVFAPAESYYGAENSSHRPKRTFTFSTVRTFAHSISNTY